MTNNTDLIERLRNYSGTFDHACVNEAANALQAAQAEIERLTADRRVLQADGKHPAPCAKFCEATAFTIELRRASAEIEREKECTELAVTQAEKLIQQRNAALARLAELTKQEPVAAQIRVAIASESGWSDWREINLSDADREYRNGVETRKLYAAAGASPLTDTAAIDAGCRYITPLLTQGASPVQPSQAGELSTEQLLYVQSALKAVEQYGNIFRYERHQVIRYEKIVDALAIVDAAINAKGSK